MPDAPRIKQLENILEGSIIYMSSLLCNMVDYIKMRVIKNLKRNMAILMISLSTMSFGLVLLC